MLNNSKTNHYIILLFFLLPIYSSHLYSMVAICQKDETCSEGFKGTICGAEGFYINGCTTKDLCPSEIVAPFRVHTCSKDYAGNSCSSGVCYFHEQILSCKSPKVCQNPGLINRLECQPCSECKSGNCQYSNGVKFRCFPFSTCSYTTITIEKVECSSHSFSLYFKNPCQCCQLIKIEDLTPQRHEGVCTKDPASAFKDEFMVDYVRRLPNGFDGQRVVSCNKFSSIMFKPGFECIAMSALVLGIVFMTL